MGGEVPCWLPGYNEGNGGETQISSSMKWIAISLIFQWFQLNKKKKVLTAYLYEAIHSEDNQVYETHITTGVKSHFYGLNIFISKDCKSFKYK